MARAVGSRGDLAIHVKGMPRHKDGGCSLDPLALAPQLVAGMLQGGGICVWLGSQKLPLLGGRRLMTPQMA